MQLGQEPGTAHRVSPAQIPVTTAMFPEPAAPPQGFPKSTARLFGRPIHPMLVPVPITCFIGTLVTDLAYVESGNPQWADFSSWLLAAGLIVSVFVVIAGGIDFLREPRIRALRQSWIHGIGNVVALGLALINALVHTRDGYTGVWPTGLTLSIAVVLILAITGWNGWSMVYRHGVTVEPQNQA